MLSVQEFSPQTGVEAFYVSVLPRGSGAGVLGSYMLLFEPCLDFFASELWAIVASEVFRGSSRPFLRLV